MDSEIDNLKYYMASEKTQNLIDVIDMTLMFMDEYSIKADDVVREMMKSRIERLKKWVETT